MKYLVVLTFLFCIGNVFSQGEEVGPLTGNPSLLAKKKITVQKSSPNTFDSTFIYNSDTLTLPLFDEFSTNKFQSYTAGYGDPGVTSIKEYRLLDLGSSPLPNNVYYTQQQTFKRKVDLANSTVSDSVFTPIQVQWGDQSSYPTSYNTIDAYPPYYIYDTLDYPNDPDTIWLTDPEIYQDSATQFFAPIDDQGLYWLDDFAYHNYTTAINPWTLGVATFDGLDPKGYPYAFGTSTSGVADYLTSKPIDMSGLAASDSIYLSFIYQGEGYGDGPEAGDSLILEFYEQGTDVWNEIWRGGATEIDSFYFINKVVDSIIYFTDAFQFRFKNIGGLSGSLDHFHLDYVHLRALSGYQDSIKDFAFVYPIKTLLDTYTSVPWDHYKNNATGKMTDALEIVVRNSNNTPANNNLGGTVEFSYGGTPEGSLTLIGADMSAPTLDYTQNFTYYSFHDFDANSSDSFSVTKPGIEEEWDIMGIAQGQFANFNGNDTTYSKQVFKNYYSYDDGTAEKAYGPTGTQARLAIKYDPYEADSLIGAMIHFVPSVQDVSNKLFLLTVWDDNAGEPGNVIYEDDVFFPRQPTYEYDRNIFTYYFLADTMKLPINGTFYIGWRQFDSDRLNVGLDMNIPNNDKTFYSIDNGNTWNQSSFAGSVMIRPIFSTAMDVTLGIEEEEQIDQVRIYPNPASDIVTIETSGLYQGVEVYDLNGRLLEQTSNSIVNMIDYESGLYIFRLIGHSKVYKVVKR